MVTCSRLFRVEMPSPFFISENADCGYNCFDQRVAPTLSEGNPELINHDVRGKIITGEVDSYPRIQ